MGEELPVLAVLVGAHDPAAGGHLAGGVATAVGLAREQLVLGPHARGAAVVDLAGEGRVVAGDEPEVLAIGVEDHRVRTVLATRSQLAQQLDLVEHAVAVPVEEAVEAVLAAERDDHVQAVVGPEQALGVPQLDRHPLDLGLPARPHGWGRHAPERAVLVAREELAAGRLAEAHPRTLAVLRHRVQQLDLEALRHGDRAGRRRGGHLAIRLGLGCSPGGDPEGPHQLRLGPVGVVEGDDLPALPVPVDAGTIAHLPVGACGHDLLAAIGQGQLEAQEGGCDAPRVGHAHAQDVRTRLQLEVTLEGLGPVAADGDRALVHEHLAGVVDGAEQGGTLDALRHDELLAHPAQLVGAGVAGEPDPLGLARSGVDGTRRLDRGRLALLDEVPNGGQEALASLVGVGGERRHDHVAEAHLHRRPLVQLQRQDAVGAGALGIEVHHLDGAGIVDPDLEARPHRAHAQLVPLLWLPVAEQAALVLNEVAAHGLTVRTQQPRLSSARHDAATVLLVEAAGPVGAVLEVGLIAVDLVLALGLAAELHARVAADELDLRDELEVARHVPRPGGPGRALARVVGRGAPHELPALETPEPGIEVPLAQRRVERPQRLLGSERGNEEEAEQQGGGSAHAPRIGAPRFRRSAERALPAAVRSASAVSERRDRGVGLAGPVGRLSSGPSRDRQTAAWQPSARATETARNIPMARPSCRPGRSSSWPPQPFSRSIQKGVLISRRRSWTRLRRAMYSRSSASLVA